MFANNMTILINMTPLTECGDIPTASLHCGPYAGPIEMLNEGHLIKHCLINAPTLSEVNTFIDRWRKEADRLGVAFVVAKDVQDEIAELEKKGHTRKDGTTTLSNNKAIRIDMVYELSGSPGSPAAFLCCGPHKASILATALAQDAFCKYGLEIDPTADEMKAYAGAVKAYIEGWRKEADRLGMAFNVEDKVLALAELEGKSEEEADDGGE
jgi:hypothetical protein